MLLGLSLAVLVKLACGATLSGEEIVRHCDNKYAGKDQRSRLIIELSSQGGEAASSEYLRLWKNYQGKDGIEDKVILFAISPLDVRGVNFMRWGYTAKTGKLADQWVYLPELTMVRRVSQRDPNSLSWGYTDEDLRIRDPGEDEHSFLNITVDSGQEFYVVESVPRGESSYSKWETYYYKTEDWQDCAPRRVDYYDKSGEVIKQQIITWKRQKGAWVWDTAVMYNLRDKISATYRMLDTEVDVGLPDRIFTERQLQRGYPDQ